MKALTTVVLGAMLLLIGCSDDEKVTDPDPPPPEETMVLVSAGTFTMGDADTLAFGAQDEHEVTLTRGFYLGKHEVTNQEYMEAVQWAYDNGYVTADTIRVRDNLDGSTVVLLEQQILNNYDLSEIRFDGAGNFYLREAPSVAARAAYPGGYDPANHPVQMVTWFGAARYCDWMSMREGLPRAYEHSGDWSCNGGDPYGAQGYRLPTDAEWEYSARWNDGRIYPWGDEDPSCDRANNHSTTYCVQWTSPVGSYPAAPASLDLYDMAGNVWEWCNDWITSTLGTSPQTDPVGPSSGSSRLIRGGSWHFNTDNRLVRCAFRAAGGTDNIYTLGFRVAKTATAP